MFKIIIQLLRFLLLNNFITSSRINFIKSSEVIPLSDLMMMRDLKIQKNNRVAIKRIPIFHDYKGGDCLLSRVSVITKKDLLLRPEIYYPNLGLKKYFTSVGRSSGTTGSPICIYRSLNSILWEHSFVRDHWRWSGFQKGMPRATLRGDVISSNNISEPELWSFNKFENQLLISSRHLKSPFIKDICNKLSNFAPYILQAYPSTAYTLALHLDEQGVSINIPYLYTSSEVLYPHQRSLIERVFGCKVMDLYGMAERVAFAAQCEFGNYHINPLYSFIEIVDDNNIPTDDMGFIVGTTLNNSTMPLLRYKLSDRGKWIKGNCSCGRSYPMIEIASGKYEDIIYGSEGNPISPSIITFAFKGLNFIQQSQVAQVADGVWEIRIVPKNGFNEDEKIRLVNNIHQLVDPGLVVNIVVTDDIPRTSAYKYRWIVNESK